MVPERRHSRGSGAGRGGAGGGVGGGGGGGGGEGGRGVWAEEVVVRQAEGCGRRRW